MGTTIDSLVSALPHPTRLTWSAATKEHFTDTGSVFRCFLIAIVVGSILTAVNLGVTLSDGQMSAGIALAIAVNYSMPFIVASLGAIATRHGRSRRSRS